MKTQKYDEFLKVFVPAQVALRRFVMAHIPDFHQAEDVLQEVALVLWKKFDDYDSERDFEPWAFAIAWNTVLRSRRDRGRCKLIFTETLNDKIAERLVERSPQLERRRKYLQACMGKMSEQNRTVIHMKYVEERPIDSISQVVGRSSNAVRALLCRIRRILAKCIRVMAMADQHLGRVEK